MIRHSRRGAIAAIATAALVAIIVGGIAAVARHRGTKHLIPVGSRSTLSLADASPPTAALAFDVPWVNRPSSPTAAFPTTTLPPTSAPPCTASDMSVSADLSEPAGSTLVTGYDFTNRSRTACMLGGYPTVVASQAGLPPIVAVHTRFKVDLPPGNVAPGKSGSLVIYTPNCDYSAYPTTLPARTYHQLVVTLPGGGQTDISTDFDPSCGGIATDPLGLPSKPAPPPPAWFSSLAATITAPLTVQAGSTLTYVINLRNTTMHPTELAPCPIYIQSVIGSNVVIKDVYALNCDRVHSILANETVRYEMRASIPSDATTGDATIGWGVVGGGVVGAQAVVHVQSHAHT